MRSARFAQRPEGAVLDGRDIGTVDLPDARREDFRHGAARRRARSAARCELAGRGERGR